MYIHAELLLANKVRGIADYWIILDNLGVIWKKIIVADKIVDWIERVRLSSVIQDV